MTRFNRRSIDNNAEIKNENNEIQHSIEKNQNTVKETVSHNHNFSVDEKELQNLKKRLDDVTHEKMRRELELKQANEQLKECKQEALKLGITSLDEMEEYVQKLNQEDQENLNKFILELAEEEKLLDLIEQQLKDLER